MNFIIEPYTPSDLKDCVDLFYDTVRHVNIRDYPLNAIEAWAPKSAKERIKKWEPHLSSNITFVAKFSSSIVGFIDMTSAGHVHGLFVSKDHQGKGIASKLLSQVEQEALKLYISILTVDASLTAKNFFRKCGFVVIQKNEVKIKNSLLTNFSMKKDLKKCF